MRRIILLVLLSGLFASAGPAQVGVGGGVEGGAYRGASLLNGTAAPSDDIGTNGDFYLNTSTHCLYGPKAAGAWSASCLAITIGYVAENAAYKGLAGGYAPLDSSGLLPEANLPAAAVTAATLGSGTLLANLAGLTTTSDASVGGNLNVAGSIYAGTGSSTPTCYHFLDTNGAHDTVLCAPAAGSNGIYNLWSAAGSAGQAATTDGGGNLKWSSLGGIAGTLASTQFPAQFGMNGNWFLNWAPAAATSGSPSVLAVTAPAHTALAAAEVNDFFWNGSRTVQITGGTTLATERSILFTPPTYAFTSPATITGAATMAIAGVPSAGANGSITGAYGLWLQGGAVSGTVTNTYALRADAATGGTRNYAAYLNGSTAIGPSATTGANQATTLTVYNGTGSGNTSVVIEAATSTPTAPPLSVVNSSGVPQVQVDAGFNLALTGGAGQHVKTAQQTTDIAGIAQLASGTVSVTFATPYNSAPVCVANSRNSTNPIKVAPTAAGVTFTSSSGTDASVINYICIGNPN
jgi:hypothetical protein